MPTLPAPLRRAVRWHRPLMAFAGASIILLAVCLVGLAADDRTLVGDPIWLKPTKFAISLAIYAVTLAWLLSLLRRGRRIGAVLGTVIALMGAGELAVIVTQVVRGRMSHFNFATPLDTALYNTMAGMIVTLWLANLVVAGLLMAQRLGERSTTWAIRLGTLIALTGMALAFLMTAPTGNQLHRMQRGEAVDVIGAHSVGVRDGGPGMPITGWSTTGGDLRVGHFVGIHGLQALILVALVLAALGTRSALLRADRVRLRLVLVAAGAYAGVLALTTWQALRGQPLVHPDGLTLGAAGALVAGTAVATAVVLVAARRAGSQPVDVRGGDAAGESGVAGAAVEERPTPAALGSQPVS